jgi:regulator of RNase E activity RraA
MATRMVALGITGTVVSGRIRDLGELKGTGLPVCFSFLCFFFFFV